MTLSEQAKGFVESHIDELSGLLTLTPLNNSDYAQATMTVITEMTAVLAGKETGELSGEAKGKAFMIALEDVAYWAVQEVQRRWYRADYGPDYDYKWMPLPPTIRQLALQEEFLVKNTIYKMKDILLAEPFIEGAAEKAAEMAVRVQSLKVGLKHA